MKKVNDIKVTNGIENIKQENLLKINIELKEKITNFENENKNLIIENSRLNVNVEEREKAISELENKLQEKFKNISNDIAKEQSKNFQEHQEQFFSNELKELKNKINEWQIENNVNYSKVGGLSEITNNLLDVFKGNTKTQGDIGEYTLENLLQKTSLRKDIDYFIQTNIDSNLRPDCLLYLPDNRVAIIDSKISVNNYRKYIETEDDNYLKQYIKDIKEHVKKLGSKEYQDNIKNLDKTTFNYVFMFFPLERAYIDALDNDNSIYELSYKNNVAITTPSSLIPILKTVEQLQKIEKQNKNLKVIFDSANKMVSKIDGFEKSMNDVKNKLEQAQESLRKANETYLMKGDGIKGLANKITSNYDNIGDNSTITETSESNK